MRVDPDVAFANALDELDELREEVARLRGQSPLLDVDPRSLTPEAFIASCQRCRQTKHLHGWHARELGAMVETLVRERDEARAEVERLKSERDEANQWRERHSKDAAAYSEQSQKNWERAKEAERERDEARAHYTAERERANEWLARLHDASAEVARLRAALETP